MALKINDNGKDRNMTKAEEAAHLAWAEQAQAEAEAVAKREALLDRLGITEEEARLLLG